MVQAMKRQMRLIRRSEFVRGLGSMLDISTSKRRPVKQTTPMGALRGDMERLGGDMRRVMDRERASPNWKPTSNTFKLT